MPFKKIHTMEPDTVREDWEKTQVGKKSKTFKNLGWGASQRRAIVSYKTSAGFTANARQGEGRH